MEHIILNLSIASASRSYGTERVSQAVNNELGQMDPSKMDVWDFMTPDDVTAAFKEGSIKNIIPSSLFLKLKSDLTTLKARLVVHGDRQILSELFGSNSSPTININVLLTALSLAAKEGYDFESVDVTAAYLNAPLTEPEHMRLSADLSKILVEAVPSRSMYLDKNGTIVVRLKKALYGLKNSGKLWYQELNNFMSENHFERSNIDKCLYTRRDGDKVTHALVYVDDILLIGNDKAFRTSIKRKLSNRFKRITQQTENDIVFLGMHIQKTKTGDITVDQHAMINEFIKEYKVTDSSTTPAAANILNQHISESSAPPSDTAFKYRFLNMKLLYLATRTSAIFYSPR